MLSFFKNKFPRHITTKSAVAASLVLHLFFTAVFGAYWVGSTENPALNHVDEVKFELEPVKFEPNFSNKSNRAYGESNPDAVKESGKASNLTKGNMNRDAILKTSLASMENLIKPFTFVTQTVLSDSTGGFSPVDGNIPGSAIQSFGTKKGKGAGRGKGIRISVGGSGGGTCKPNGGPIILP